MSSETAFRLEVRVYVNINVFLKLFFFSKIAFIHLCVCERTCQWTMTSGNLCSTIILIIKIL